jgi:hypothetical protein
MSRPHVGGKGRGILPRLPKPGELPQWRPNVDESVGERLARTETALAALLAQREAEAQRGQPDQARSPPDDNSLKTYSVAEVAAIFKVSVSAVYAAITAKQIPCVKIAGRKLIPHIGLLRLLAADPGAIPTIGNTAEGAAAE